MNHLSRSCSACRFIITCRPTAIGASCYWRRTFASTLAAAPPPDPLLVNASNAPTDYDHSAVVYGDFIQPHESDVLVEDLRRKLKRRRYEKGHWDAVIVQYKEVEVMDEETSLSAVSRDIFQRVRTLLQERHAHAHDHHDDDHPLQFLPSHVIDLHADGQLNAHVDSVRFSGHLVAGLSLLSPSIMRLRPEHEKNDGDQENNDKENHVGNCEDGHVDLYLPPLSLYVLSGDSRYKYTHELLPSGSTFCAATTQNDDDSSSNSNSSIQVTRDHRLSVIFRDARPPDNEDDDDNNGNS